MNANIPDIQDFQFSSELSTKLKRLSTVRPYVWELRLNAGDFRELESRLAQADAKEILGNQRNALAAVAYLAEWYKREYCVDNKDGYRSTVDVDTARLWKAAGLDATRFHYEGSTWLYSIFVLGGLAVRHELRRNDDGFLKTLCRVLHGEERDLDKYDEAQRAIAFRQSIKQHESLYWYLTEIVNSNGLSADDPAFNALMERIRHANDEVLRDKFRLEWLVYRPTGGEAMSRNLVLWLNPEETGEGLHQYLRYDRLRSWGIPEPESLKSLWFKVRFLESDREVASSGRIMTYDNSAGVGFLCLGNANKATVKSIPTERFDAIEVIAVDENGIEYVTQRQAIPHYMQLWCVDVWNGLWSSRTDSQGQTALLFSKEVALNLSEAEKSAVSFLKFADKKYGTSEPWGWYYITDKVSVVEGPTFYNRIGYDVISPRLYSNTIHYEQGEKIRTFDLDGLEELLPVIFSKDDIQILHFEAKDDDAATNEIAAELIEYKQPNGKYTEWTEDRAPRFGTNTLRITIKGVSRVWKCCLLPGPVPLRNIENQAIVYHTIEGERKIIDSDELSGTPLSPSIEIEICNALLRIYRPRNLKEICVEGKVELRSDSDAICLPYIEKPRVTINCFDSDGYISYPCSNLCDIFPLLKTEAGSFQMTAWKSGKTVNSSALDAYAPKWLSVSLSGETNEKPHGKWYMWDCSEDNQPERVEPGTDPLPNNVVFQSRRRNTDPLSAPAPIEGRKNPFVLRRLHISKLKCFEMAVKHNIYFFTFLPLVDIDYVSEIYRPLMEERNNNLTAEDIQALLRLAEEFCFDWNQSGIKLTHHK